LLNNQKYGNKVEEAQSFGNIAYTYSQLKNYPKAFDNYQKSIDLAKQAGFDDVLAVSYKDLAETYELKGDTEKALETYQLYHEIHLKNMETASEKKVKELEVKYDTALKDKQLMEQAKAIELLEQEKVIRQQKLWLAIIGLGSLLAISFQLFFKQKEKVKQINKDKAIKEEIQRKVLALKEQEKNFLEKQLDNKNKDITTLTLDIIRKNDFSEKLKTQLTDFESTLPKKYQAKIRNISLFTQSHLAINDELAKLQINIEEINQEFYEKLAEIAKFSQSEKQICGLIRLNLSNKEIALIRNTTTESTKVFRYRIRKKLGLNPEEDIVNFLKSL